MGRGGRLPRTVEPPGRHRPGWCLAGAYVVVEMPIFLAWITVLVIASIREGPRIARGLTPYVRTGWVLPAEVAMVSTRGGRRAARA